MQVFIEFEVKFRAIKDSSYNAVIFDKRKLTKLVIQFDVNAMTVLCPSRTSKMSYRYSMLINYAVTVVNNQ